MNDFTLKLIKNTIKNIEEFADECLLKVEKWKGTVLAEYYDGQARAFRMTAEFLKKDIEIGEEIK